MKNWDKNIELRSEDVKDIIGKTPSWLVRWGTLTICIVVLLLLVGAALFNYPDRLSSSVTILSDEPPVEIIAKSNGIIDRLFVSDTQRVSQNQILAVIESSVDYSFVTGLEADLDSISVWLGSMNILMLDSFVNVPRPQPGVLKTDFSVFTNAIKQYISFVKLAKYSGRIQAAKKELNDTKIHYDRLYEQRRLRKVDLELSKKQLERQTELFDSGTISAIDYEAATQSHLDKKFQFEQSRSELSQYQIKIDQIQSQIGEYEVLESEENQVLVSDIERSLTDLKGAIAEWEQNFLFRAPLNGFISFTKFWTEKQAVKIGEKVMTVIPAESSTVIGKLALPVVGSGKAKVGQRVLVKVDKYPYMEYGVLEGIVRTISLVSDENFYSVEIAFPKGMLSSYNRELILSQGMSGQAEIITENMSFLVRIVNPIRYLFNQNNIID